MLRRKVSLSEGSTHDLNNHASKYQSENLNTYIIMQKNGKRIPEVVSIQSLKY
jgi:hypothetical protein